MNLADYCTQLAHQAREAALILATLSTEKKNRWLAQSADALQDRADEIREANERDLADSEGLTNAQRDRLRLTPARIEAASEGLREVAALADPVGQVRDTRVRPNGLQVSKVGVPLGVILFIYESRPNVTIDAAGLCVKSGNAIVLRGGREALHSNQTLHKILQETLTFCGLPTEAVQVVNTPDREVVGHLLKMKDDIDLVIPRGGEGLIRRVSEEATMPVLRHYLGNCHVYVERSACADMAERIVVNSKCQRTGVCNAAESLLVDEAIAESMLPRLANKLIASGVELRGCPRTCELVAEAKPATAADFAAEFLDLVMSVKVVANLDEAVSHIREFGSGHTESIVTNDLSAARAFTARVDSSAVLVNASTRFNDGQALGLGAEIGISTDKYHARGPCGLLELTSYKYIVYGEGQIRE